MKKENYDEIRIKQIKCLKKRYEYYKFNVEYPVLDIGGGDGFFLESQGIKNAEIIDLTHLKNKNYKYISTDLTKKLPNLKKKYKTIFITEVLEHLHNPLYLLAQVYDLLDDGGTCYISIPYTKLYNRKHSLGEWDSGHVCRWQLKEILNQTKKLGFKSRVIQKRRRFKNTAFCFPHCWLVIGLKKII